MREILKTNDVVFLSFVRALLKDQGIDSVLLDEHMSVLEGSLGILPRRLMVAEEDESRARILVQQAKADRGDPS